MSLIGGSSQAPKGKPPSGSPKELVTIARQRNALLALSDWLDDLDEGVASDVGVYAKRHNLTKRQFLKVIRENPRMAENLFGDTMTECKLGITKAVSLGIQYLHDERTVRTRDGELEVAVSPAEQRRWAEFLAKLVGGAYEARKTEVNLTLAALVPELAPSLKEIEHRVVEPREEGFEDLLA